MKRSYRFSISWELIRIAFEVRQTYAQPHSEFVGTLFKSKELLMDRASGKPAPYAGGPSDSQKKDGKDVKSQGTTSSGATAEALRPKDSKSSYFSRFRDFVGLGATHSVMGAGARAVDGKAATAVASGLSDAQRAWAKDTVAGVKDNAKRAEAAGVEPEMRIGTIAGVYAGQLRQLSAMRAAAPVSGPPGGPLAAKQEAVEVLLQPTEIVAATQALIETMPQLLGTVPKEHRPALEQALWSALISETHRELRVLGNIEAAHESNFSRMTPIFDAYYALAAKGPQQAKPLADALKQASKAALTDKSPNALQHRRLVVMREAMRLADMGDAQGLDVYQARMKLLNEVSTELFRGNLATMAHAGEASPGECVAASLLAMPASIGPYPSMDAAPLLTLLIKATKEPAEGLTVVLNAAHWLDRLVPVTESSKRQYVNTQIDGYLSSRTELIASSDKLMADTLRSIASLRDPVLKRTVLETLANHAPALERMKTAITSNGNADLLEPLLHAFTGTVDALGMPAHRSPLEQVAMQLQAVRAMRQLDVVPREAAAAAAAATDTPS